MRYFIVEYEIFENENIWLICGLINLQIFGEIYYGYSNKNSFSYIKNRILNDKTNAYVAEIIKLCK